MSFGRFIRKKSCEELLTAVNEGAVKLHRSIGTLQLIALGIGAIVGAGIFVITGTAAAGYINQAGEIVRTPAGPAITLSFILTAIGCTACALCYAEFASMVPVSGSAYTYAYVSMGEIFAWIIGWDLLLEYTFDAATVSIGWGGYLQQVLVKAMGITIPDWLTTPSAVVLSNQAAYSNFPHVGGVPLSVNLPPMIIIALLSALLVLGMRKSARFNSVVVALKLAIVLIFIFVGAFYVKPENWVPYIPYGVRGVLAGASMIFFAYIGFDALSTTSEEVKNPSRNLPLGILGSLAICTVLYIIVSAILTGIAPYTILGTPDPVATALDFVGQHWLASYIVSVGAVIALTSTLLVFLMGQPRIIFAMARDGFFPKWLAKVHPKYMTPYRTTIISGTVVMFLAGFGDLSDVASLCNAGTLTAFVMVCIGIMILRVRHPDMPRPFKVPMVPFVPLVGIVICGVLFFSLPGLALKAFVVWSAAGLLLYLCYGSRRTRYA